MRAKPAWSTSSTLKKAKGRIPGFAAAVSAPAFPDSLPDAFPDLLYLLPAEQNGKETIADATTTSPRLQDLKGSETSKFI